MSAPYRGEVTMFCEAACRHGAVLILRRSRLMRRVVGQAAGGRPPLGIVASLNLDFAWLLGLRSRFAVSTFDRLPAR